MKKQHVQLTKEDREQLERLIKQETLPTRVYRRALGLLELDRGKTITAVAETLQVSRMSLTVWSKKYQEDGLKLLNDQPRSGRPPGFTGEQRAQITALACSAPPEGYGRWSLRLLADKVVEMGFCEYISHTEVADILKKTR
jgi:transposase